MGNRQLNFTVSTFNDTNSDRHGDPMVYMQNPGDGNYYSLGMFSQDSNKLPVSANFTAHAVSDGKTVELSIEPDSIIVPYKELPKSPKKLRSKARRKEAAKTQRTNQDRLSSIINKREKYRCF